MNDILTAPFMTEMIRTATNMYAHGWDERNGGNISMLLDEAEVREHLVFPAIVRTIPTGFTASELDGKIFLVTGTGKYSKTFSTTRQRISALYVLRRTARKQRCSGVFRTEADSLRNSRRI